jgi:SET domain-containing protein
MDDKAILDATVHGGLARYINHSCDPNCYTRIFQANGHKRMGIYAKRNITAGQELHYDYKVGWAGRVCVCVCN